jgi:hypothetical protein
MKNLKKIISGMTLVLTMFIGSNASAQELSALSKDTTFISYVKDQLEFNKNSNIELVNELASQEEMGEGQLELFYEAFKTNEEDYTSFVKTQQGRLNVLYQVYELESLSAEDLSPYFEDTLTQLGVGQEQSQTMGDNCGRRYRNTLAINLGTAVVAHLGCGFADMTVVAGLICHGAVYLVHSAADDNAYLDYLDCIK